MIDKNMLTAQKVQQRIKMLIFFKNGWLIKLSVFSF